jgi:hypothetical protein
VVPFRLIFIPNPCPFSRTICLSLSPPRNLVPFGLSNCSKLGVTNSKLVVYNIPNMGSVLETCPAPAQILSVCSCSKSKLISSDSVHCGRGFNTSVRSHAQNLFPSMSCFPSTNRNSHNVPQHAVQGSKYLFDSCPNLIPFNSVTHHSKPRSYAVWLCSAFQISA